MTMKRDTFAHQNPLDTRENTVGLEDSVLLPLAPPERHQDAQRLVAQVHKIL
jgi:hypothetical protein